MLHWALTAAALLLFAYAVRTVFLSSRGEGDEGRQKLGCGFAVVAALLWMYVLNRYLESPLAAVRIGLGALLVLPAVQVLARPAGARILRAALGLVLAVLIAGPPLRDLVQRFGPDTRSDAERDLAERIADLEELRASLAGRGEALATLRADVKAEIRAAGKSFEEIQADEALLQRLEVLRRIDDEAGRVAASLEKVDARLPELRSALESTRAAEVAEEPGRDAELEALRKAFEDAPPLDELSIVEQHAREQELRALYETEF